MNKHSFDSPSPLYVRLYGRADCPQCDEAAEMLASMRGQFDFRIEKVNIESDLALREKFDSNAVVVTFDGANRVQMPITPQKLRRAIKKARQVEADDDIKHTKIVQEPSFVAI